MISKSLADYDSRMINELFQYSIRQFLALRATTVAFVSISLAASVIVVCIYTYMLVFHQQKANRVSLRCVFFACILDVIYAVFTIVRTTQSGYTPFCKSISVILKFLNLLRSTLLALVGVNLVLLFVYGVSKTDRLERYYYPAAIIYSLAGICIPIYEQVISTESDNRRQSCWYMESYEHRSVNGFSWMWFYAFIFFVNMIAVICSVLALMKLIREQKAFVSSMEDINHTSTLANPETERQIEDSVKRRQHTVLKKVVLRCIIYPLVPFLVNIFGFILQVILTTTHRKPPYALSMLNTIFTTLAGLLVAIVFFTDPATTEFISQSYNKYYRKYVVDYVIVLKPKMDTSCVVSPASSIRSSLLPLTNPPTVISPVAANSNPSLYEIRPASCLDVVCDEKSIKEQQTTTPSVNKEEEYTKVIMRRINDINTIQKLKQSNTPQSQQVISADSEQVFIPYRHLRTARFLHFLLTGFGLKSKPNKYHGATIYEMNELSNATLCGSEQEGSSKSIPETYTNNTRHY